MAQRRKAVLANLEGVELLFRNFEGKEDKYNKAGDRNFCVRLTPEMAADMERDGWNIKRRDPRDPDDDPLFYIPVKVSYANIPPKVIVITKRNKKILSEDMLAMLDWAEIENCDVILSAYDWTVNGESGRKAYLKSLYVTIVEDKFSEKYEDVPFAGEEYLEN